MNGMDRVHRRVSCEVYAYAYAYAFNRFEHRPLSLLYVPPVLRDLRRTVAQSVAVSAVSAVPVEVADRKGAMFPRFPLRFPRG